MASYPGHVWLRMYAYPALFIGLILFLLGSTAVFNSDEANCDGQTMQSGEVCGPNAIVSGQGRSYEDVASWTSVERKLGYAGIALLISGTVCAIAGETLGRR